MFYLKSFGATESVVCSAGGECIVYDVAIARRV